MLANQQPGEGRKKAGLAVLNGSSVRGHEFGRIVMLIRYEQPTRTHLCAPWLEGNCPRTLSLQSLSVARWLLAGENLRFYSSHSDHCYPCRFSDKSQNITGNTVQTRLRTYSSSSKQMVCPRDFSAVVNIYFCNGTSKVKINFFGCNFISVEQIRIL